MCKIILLAAVIPLAGACVATASPESPVEHRQWLAAAPSTGVVVTESGEPLAGVRYWLSGFEERTADGWRVAHFSGIAGMHLTGKDGRFEVPQREGLRSDVDFDRSGFVPAFVQELEPGQEIRVVMRRGLDVRGRVRQRTREGNGACEGARVAIRRPNSRGLWFQTEVVTNADGEFVFHGFLEKSRSGEAESAAESPNWELVCSGASFELPERVDRPIDDLEIDVAISRGP